MPNFDARSPIQNVIRTPESRAVLERIAPEVLAAPMIQDLGEFPTGSLLKLLLGDYDERRDRVLEAIVDIDDPTPVPDETPAVTANSMYEPASVDRGSASLRYATTGRVGHRIELELVGPSHGNPFVDVELSALFTCEGQGVSVGGFYDGDGRYAIRFLPPAAGRWSFETSSTARSLDGLAGTIEVEATDARGPVRVADRFHFAYDNGTPYLPIGTTAYVWTHQGDALEEQTIATLTNAPFTKIRMGLFPKHFLYNANEPERFVFPRADEGWDTTRFDVEYFRHLEHRIDQLADIGVEADLILFHPYDRWGFSRLGRAADDRYIRYVVRRLAALPNVWWSLANEYDLMLGKTSDDWRRIAGIIEAEDYVGHLRSIHNWLELWDFADEWVTHCSIQNGDLGGEVNRWRATWGKPVLVDECGYEGDIDQGWGSLTSQEMVRRFWDVAVRGGYATHGETYRNRDDVLWWAKGGVLHGDTAPRIAFLRDLIAAAPTGRWEPLPSDWDTQWAGVDGKYVVLYCGANRPGFRDVRIPDGMRAQIDVVDTWNMTIKPVEGVHEGLTRVELPARPYVAIRLRATE